MPKPGFSYFTPRMAYFFSITDVFYFMYNVLYSLSPSIARTTYLLLYICLSFSAMDTAWSVRRVSPYIRRHLLYLYL